MFNEKRYFKIRQRTEKLPHGGEVYSLTVGEHYPNTENILDEQVKYPIRAWFSDVFPLGPAYMKATAHSWLEFLKSFNSIYQIVLDHTLIDHTGAVLEHEIEVDFIEGVLIAHPPKSEESFS
jgi:hypothetical protein